MKITTPTATLDFKTRLKIGMDFEETASTFLTSQGFPIKLNFSANGQHEFGESAAHVEIKFDRKFQDTGNLFIETSERRDENSLWRASGIYDEHEPWFFCIGGPPRLWLLSVRWLVKMHKTGKYRFITTGTAQGFIIPVQLAEDFAIKIWLNWLTPDQAASLRQDPSHSASNAPLAACSSPEDNTHTRPQP